MNKQLQSKHDKNMKNRSKTIAYLKLWSAGFLHSSIMLAGVVDFKDLFFVADDCCNSRSRNVKLVSDSGHRHYFGIFFIFFFIISTFCFSVMHCRLGVAILTEKQPWNSIPRVVTPVFLIESKLDLTDFINRRKDASMRRYNRWETTHGEKNQSCLPCRYNRREGVSL